MRDNRAGKGEEGCEKEDDGVKRPSGRERERERERKEKLERDGEAT